MNFRWPNKIAINVKHNVSTARQPIRARRRHAENGTLYGAIEFTSMSEPKYGSSKYAVSYRVKYGACHAKYGKYGTNKPHTKQEYGTYAWSRANYSTPVTQFGCIGQPTSKVKISK